MLYMGPQGFRESQDVIDVPSGPFELIGIDKTNPVKLLENRRTHLMQWLRDGEQTIRDNEAEIKKTKEDAITMMAELEEIEAALNVLEANAARIKESNDGGK